MFDVSSAGVKEGLIKVAKVAGYIVVSMIVVGLGTFVKDQTIPFKDILPVVLVAGANLLLVFLQTWLSTHKPE